MAAEKHLPDNGTGGEAGTHEGHADNVPEFGLGYASADEQTPGNNASRQYAAEHNLRGPKPTGVAAMRAVADNDLGGPVGR